MVFSLKGDINYDDIFSGNLQRDRFRENAFTFKRERSRRYSSETLIDTNYAEDQEHLANTSAQNPYCIA